MKHNNKIFKPLLSFMIFFLLFNLGFSFCFLNDPPKITNIDYVVFDENSNYLGTLSSLNWTIRENDYLIVTIYKQDNDNIENNFEFHLLRDAKYSSSFQTDFMDYPDFTNVLLNNVHNSNTAIDYYKIYTGQSKNNNIGYYSINYYKQNSQNTYETIVYHNITPNIYSLLVITKDGCNDYDYKFQDLIVEPKPFIDHFTCDFNNPIVQLNHTISTNLVIDKGCQKIISDGYYNYYITDLRNNTISKPITIENKGNFYFLDLKPKNIIDNLNGESYFHFNLDTNNNHITKYCSALRLYNYNGYAEIEPKNCQYYGIFIYHTLNLYINVSSYAYLYEPIKYANVTFNGKGSGYFIISPWNPSQHILDYAHNYFNFISASRLEVEAPEDNIIINIYDNYFNNIPLLRFMFGMFGEFQPYFYANTFKFLNEPTFDTDGGYMGNDLILSKNINGDMLGNIWLDANGNDYYSCDAPLKDIYFNGKMYKVCSEPVLLDQVDNVNIYDYIIVTDENKGGSEPINLPKKPIASIWLNKSYPHINEPVEWDISHSYDEDGTIVRTKLYVDNVLYENIQKGVFTSETPKTIILTLEVTDNDGLTDTTNNIVQFLDTPNNCIGNHEPDADIESIYLGNNTFTFRAVNITEIDNDNLSFIWYINDKYFTGKEVTIRINKNQTIYLTISDRCSSHDIYKRVTIEGSSDPYTIPSVHLTCSLSSQTPISNLDCSVDYDTLGFGLKNIKWYLDGVELHNYENRTEFYTLISDTNQHTLVVDVISNKNSNSDSFIFKLSQNPVYISNTTSTQTNKDSFQEFNNTIISDDIEQTNQNVIGIMGSLSDMFLNTGLRIGIFMFVMFLVGAVVRIITI